MRDPTVTAWPDYLAPLNMSVTMDRPIFKGPKPLDGREQVVASSAGGWLISYSAMPIHTTKYRVLKALLVSLGAFGKPVYVKPEFSPNMLAKRNNISAVLTPFSDATTFSDGTQLAQSTGDCTLASSAVRGDVTIYVNNSVISPVQYGDYFELDGRLHLVQSIDGQKWGIWPPLRSNYAAGATLEIDDPRCLMYLTPDSAALALNIEFGRLSRVNIDFIEAGW